jgi:SpoVK/Ycf46/Vps4 family AAA+-type ATPase
MKPLHTLAHFLTSKAVVDKVKMPPKYYEMFVEKIESLEAWSSVFRSVEADKPYTWVSSGLKFLKKISEVEEDVSNLATKDLDRCLTALRYEEPYDTFTDLVCADLISRYRDRAKMFLKTDIGRLYYLELGGTDDVILFLESDMNERYVYVPRFSTGSERLTAFGKGLADLYWEGKSCVRTFSKEGDVQIEDVDPPDREYEGLLVRLYDDLPAFRASGVRRCVLFQGLPGTGKSTLVLNLAKRISKRTLILTKDVFAFSDSCLQRMFSVLNPEMVILDDIDRYSGQLESELYLFEEDYCNAPYIIFTSNHYDRLPDAFRRPGRIDEIIQMQNPPKEVRYDIVKTLAKREGLDVPEDKLGPLDEIHSKYPSAYILEYLRRVKIHGWDYTIPDYDLTFGELNSWEYQESKSESGELDLLTALLSFRSSSGKY